MPNPVGRSTSFESSESVSNAAQTSSPVAPRPDLSCQPQGNSVVSWSGAHPDIEPPVQGSTDGVKSAAELQAQAAREAQARQALGKVMDELGGAFDNFAKSTLGDARADFHALSATIDRSRTLKAAASKLSRDDFREAIAARLREANPSLSERQVNELTGKALKAMGEWLCTETSQRMKDKVVSMMRSAAEQFRATAKDPEQVAKLVRVLQALESKKTPEAEQVAERLRAQLGLANDGSPVTREKVAEALEAQAKLIDREARAMHGKEGGPLFRALLKQDVGALVTQDMGAKPGSWAAEQVAAVRGAGEYDQALIDAAKTGVGLALSAVTLGMAGAAGPLAMMLGPRAASLAVNAPDVLVAFHERDAASAGASAGTTSTNANQVAQRNASVELTEVIILTALAGPFTAGGAVHAAAAMASAPAKELAKDLVKDVVIHKVLGEVAHSLEGEFGSATGESAIDQAHALGGD